MNTAATPQRSVETTPPFSNADQALLHAFLKNPDHPLPISNPMALALGAELCAADPRAGTVKLAFQPQALFIQGTDVLQGGAVSAMLDFAMAFATLADLPIGYSCATINLSTSFLRPAPAGRYIAVGEIERRGRQLSFTRAQLFREGHDQVVSTATSTLMVLLPPPAK